MTTWTSIATGRVQASEADVIVRPKFAPTSPMRGVLYCHGREAANGGAAEWQKYERAVIVNAIASAGYTVLSCDLGGLSTWGNSTSVTRVGTAYAYLIGLSGVLPTKAVVMGHSMGGLVALNWIAQNLASCSCFIGHLPGLDLTDTHTNNRGGWASEINTAYGGTYSEASFGATYNPQTRAAAGAFGSLPMQLWSGSTDATFPPAQFTAFAASVGASCLVRSIVGGHAEATIANISTPDSLSFMANNA